MAPVKISIPHDLGREEARRRLADGLARVPAMGTVAVDKQAWSGDRMTFLARAFGAAIPGAIEVSDKLVLLEIDLPSILRPLAQRIQPALAERARLLLGKR